MINFPALFTEPARSATASFAELWRRRRKFFTSLAVYVEIARMIELLQSPGTFKFKRTL